MRSDPGAVERQGESVRAAAPVIARSIDSSAPACMSEPSEPAAELPAAAVAGLPGDLLEGGETIILLLKPHPLYIVLSCLGTLVLLAGIAFGSIWLQRSFQLELFNEQAMLGLCLLLASLRLIWQFLEWMSRTYVLTDRRVIRIMGVVRVQMFQAELRRLQHTQILWSLRERLFGLGTISFSTAGTGFPEAYWVMLANPVGVHKKILQAIERYGR